MVLLSIEYLHDGIFQTLKNSNFLMSSPVGKYRKRIALPLALALALGVNKNVKVLRQRF